LVVQHLGFEREGACVGVFYLLHESPNGDHADLDAGSADVKLVDNAFVFGKVGGGLGDQFGVLVGAGQFQVGVEHLEATDDLSGAHQNHLAAITTANAKATTAKNAASIRTTYRFGGCGRQ